VIQALGRRNWFSILVELHWEYAFVFLAKQFGSATKHWYGDRESEKGIYCSTMYIYGNIFPTNLTIWASVLFQGQLYKIP
jgi:hypothetical protein